MLPILGLLIALGGPSPHAQRALPDRFGEWTASGPATKAAPTIPDRAATEAAAVLSEAGLVEQTGRDYTSQSAVLTVTLYRMRDPSGAYALFTYMRPLGAVDADFAQYAAVAHDQAVLMTGNLVADVRGLQAAALSDLHDLAAALSAIAEHSPLPPIRNYLPVRGRIAGSTRYAMGPVGIRSALGDLSSPALAGTENALGPSREGAEAVLARYRVRDHVVTFLIVEFPTPQLAEKALMEVAAPDAQGAAPRGLIARRKSSLLCVVFQPKSVEEAQTLLQAVPYETEVTWNEPAYKATDPAWGVVILGILLSTGVLMAYAFVGGLGFGLLRILTKRLFPDKVFDRSAQHEILQLGLSGRPIQWKDFY
jgi:hypothetical protein